MIRKKYIPSWILIIGFFVFDIPPGYLTFQYLCSSEAGAVVFEPVYADGYAKVDTKQFNIHPTNAGIQGCPTGDEWNFKYIEVDVNNPRNNFINQKGKYRCTLEYKGSPLCAQFEAADEIYKQRWYRSIQNYGKENPLDYCPGTLPIENFQSRYVLISEDAPVWMRMLGIKYFFKIRLIDSFTGKATAQYVYPEYAGGWLQRSSLWNFETGNPKWRLCKSQKDLDSEYTDWIIRAISPLHS